MFRSIACEVAWITGGGTGIGQAAAFRRGERRPQRAPARAARTDGLPDRKDGAARSWLRHDPGDGGGRVRDRIEAELGRCDILVSVCVNEILVSPTWNRGYLEGVKL